MWCVDVLGIYFVIDAQCVHGCQCAQKIARAREALPLLAEAEPEPKGKRRGGSLLTNSHTVFVDSRREGEFRTDAIVFEVQA